MAGSSALTPEPLRANEYVILGRNDLYREDVTAMSCVLMATCPRARPSGLGLEQGDIDSGFTLAASHLKALEGEDGITASTVPSAGF